MNIHKLRYLFEHRMLPDWFFREGDRLVAALLQDETLLFRIMADLLQKEGIRNPYTQRQFVAAVIKKAGPLTVLKITFPQPENEPLCYCSYLIFDNKFEKTAYFCIEKGNTIGKELPFLCRWTEDGSHLNCGACPHEEEQELKRCLEIVEEE